MKKVELIIGSIGAKKIICTTATGTTEEPLKVSITKPWDTYVEIVAYVEKYINEHGFTIKSMDKEQQTLFFLLEKDA